VHNLREKEGRGKRRRCRVGLKQHAEGLGAKEISSKRELLRLMNLRPLPVERQSLRKENSKWSAASKGQQRQGPLGRSTDPKGYPPGTLERSMETKEKISRKKGLTKELLSRKEWEPVCRK